jgi:hypothetical protein
MFRRSRRFGEEYRECKERCRERLPYAQARISLLSRYRNKSESRDERRTFTDIDDAAETHVAQAFQFMCLLRAGNGAAE